MSPFRQKLVEALVAAGVPSLEEAGQLADAREPGVTWTNTALNSPKVNEGRFLAHLAEAFRMSYEVHHGGNSLNNVANLHVIAAIRNTTFFEVLLPDGAQKYGLVEDITVGRDGMVHAPTQPGLGYEIDCGLIERKKMAVLS